MGPDGTPVALKVLAEERPSADKRRRFKNDISFLVGNKHRNIVTVIDHGVARGWCDRGSVQCHAEASGVDARVDLMRRWINAVQLNPQRGGGHPF